MSKWQSWASSAVLGAFKPSSSTRSCLLLPAFHCPRLRYLTRHCVFVASSLIVVLGGRSCYRWEGKGSLGQATRWIVPGHMAKVWQKPYWGRQSGIYLSTLVIICSPVTRFSTKPSFWRHYEVFLDWLKGILNTTLRTLMFRSAWWAARWASEETRGAYEIGFWGTAITGLGPLPRKVLEIWVLTQTEEVACW